MFWDWLRERLKERGWSQGELERRMGLSKGHVSHWKSGRTGITRRNCEQLAEVLSQEFAVVPVEEVLEAAGHDPEGTKLPLTGGQAGLHDVQQRLNTIERGLEALTAGLRRSGLIPTELEPSDDVQPIRVVGRVPADSLRWTAIGDESREVEVLRSVVAHARAPIGIEVAGDCLRSLGIWSGDIVICDRAEGREPRDRQLVVVRVGDEVTLKRWCVVDGGVELRDGDEQVVYTLSEADDVEVIAFYITYLVVTPR